jgi:hypothetical protein
MLIFLVLSFCISSIVSQNIFFLQTACIRRLLVRLSGGYEYCLNNLAWVAMGAYNVAKHKQSKGALKSMKAIGRGGVSRDFLQIVHPVRHEMFCIAIFSTTD